MRILVIEDDRDLRVLLTEILSETASCVVGAVGAEGLSRPAGVAERYDVAFTDLVPLQSYDEGAARRWVERVRAVARRVVVVTGHQAAVSGGAGALGADFLVSKPFELEAILAAVVPSPA